MRLDEDWLSPAAVADAIREPLRTILRWCANGTLPAVRSASGKRWRIDARALEARYRQDGHNAAQSIADRIAAKRELHRAARTGHDLTRVDSGDGDLACWSSQDNFDDLLDDIVNDPDPAPDEREAIEYLRDVERRMNAPLKRAETRTLLRAPASDEDEGEPAATGESTCDNYTGGPAKAVSKCGAPPPTGIRLLMAA